MRGASAATRCLHSRHTAAPAESGGGISVWLYGTKNMIFRVLAANAVSSASSRSIPG